MYLRLGGKPPITHSTLNDLGKFIAAYFIPKKFIIYIQNIFGADGLWKHVLGIIFTSLFLPEPDKHNQNPVELVI